jgi:hypothetical protein
MVRMYVAQQCFGLSDEGIEDAISPIWCWPAGALPSLKPEEPLDRRKA